MTFTDLYPHLFRSCRQLARRLLGDDDLAEQTAAEALARLYEHRNRLNNDPDHQRAWALRVTRNLAVDELRHRGRHQPLSDTDAETLDSTSELLLRMVTLDAIAHLPEGQRRSIELRYLNDLSQVATASVLGVRPGTIATHISRAFTDLRRRLANEAPLPSTTPTQEKPAMKINTIEQAKQLIGTDRTVTAQLLDHSDKDKISADIGIPVVYRRRGQMLVTGCDEPRTEIECAVIDMHDERRPLVTDATTGRTPTDEADLAGRVSSLQPGQQLTGTVAAVLPFGVFVEFDGLRGLIHDSDRGADASLQPGQQVDVEVTAVDTRLARISIRTVQR